MKIEQILGFILELLDGSFVELVFLYQISLLTPWFTVLLEEVFYEC